MNPSMPGISASTIASWNGRFCSWACCNRRTASTPDSASVTSVPSAASIAPRIRRLVRLSSTASTRNPRKISGLAGFRSTGFSKTRSHRMVKWKRLPFPGSLSTQILPPINSVSLFAIASPKPVPPLLRVIDPSACVNASKINRSFSAGIPMPVSSTRK